MQADSSVSHGRPTMESAQGARPFRAGHGDLTGTAPQVWPQGISCKVGFWRCGLHPERARYPCTRLIARISMLFPFWVHARYCLPTQKSSWACPVFIPRVGVLARTVRTRFSFGVGARAITYTISKNNNDRFDPILRRRPSSGEFERKVENSLRH